MRTIIIFLAVMLAQTAAYGQADDLLDRAAQACLSIRQAVAERSADNVMLGMEKLEELPFSNLTLTDVDTGGEASLRGHLQYDMQYLDSLLLCDMDMSLIQVDGPFVLRNQKAKILCTHRAVKAQSAVTYSIRAQGRQSLVVVSENGRTLNLHVNDKANGRKLSDASPGGKELCRLDWTVEKPSTIDITIENKAQTDTSFIIISN